MSGGDSQFALVRLSSTYLEAQKNGNLLSNRAGMDVLDKRIVQLLERLENQDYPEQFAAFRELWEEYKGVEGTIEAIKVRKKIDSVCDATFHDYMAFTQIQSIVETRRKLSETEAKILKDMHAILTAEDAYKLTAQLLAAITGAVQQEPEISPNVKAHLLKRIIYEFTRIIGETTGDGHEEQPLRSLGEVIDSGSGELDRA